jgi:hypothetical protein
MTKEEHKVTIVQQLQQQSLNLLVEKTEGWAAALQSVRSSLQGQDPRNADRFIAGRVDETLKAGEVGLIFLGLLHRLERFLPPDIEMRCEAWWVSRNA